MAEFPALTLWTDAYLSDTRFLTTVEHGAYLLLLIEAWRRPHCDLPDDDQMLARMTGLPIDQWETIKSTILTFWNLDGRSKTWKQKRLTKERDAARMRSKSQRDKAVKRWNRTENNDAPASPRHKPGNASITTATATAIKEDTSIEVLSTAGADDPPPPPEIFELELQGGDAAPADLPLTPNDILETWNDMAPRHNLPVVRGKLTEARIRQCKVRIREHPDREDWARAFRCIASTPFLLGDNPRGWRADFDFLIQAKSFTKLLEGSYGEN